MKAEILKDLDRTFLVLPKMGFAPMLLLEHLQSLRSMNINVYPVIQTEPILLMIVGDHNFCIELLGPTLNKVAPSLYDFCLAYINGNLEDSPLDEDF
jgi:hypothetical protein